MRKIYRVPASDDGFRPEVFVAGKLEGTDLETVRFYESSRGGAILNTSAPILGPLTEEAVLSLGGVLVKTLS